MKYLSLLILFCLNSCNEQSPDKLTSVASANAESKQLISADELMRSLGASDFHVQIPEDLRPSDMVGINVRSAGGVICESRGSTSWRAGEMVRVIIFPRKGADVR